MLLIRSHCKICPLPTILSRVFVLFATDTQARLYCRQCAHFTTGTNKQNQYFAQLRQKVCLYIYVVVFQRGLRSLDGKLERFATKTRVRLTIAVCTCMCRDPLWQNTSALDLGGKLVTYFMRDGTKPYRP